MGEDNRVSQNTRTPQGGKKGGEDNVVFWKLQILSGNCSPQIFGERFLGIEIRQSNIYLYLISM